MLDLHRLIARDSFQVIKAPFVERGPIDELLSDQHWPIVSKVIPLELYAGQSRNSIKLLDICGNDHRFLINLRQVSWTGLERKLTRVHHLGACEFKWSGSADRFLTAEYRRFTSNFVVGSQ